MHQASDSEVGQQEAVNLLTDQVWGLAPKNDLGPPQVGLELAQLHQLLDDFSQVVAHEVELVLGLAPLGRVARELDLLIGPRGRSRTIVVQVWPSAVVHTAGWPLRVRAATLAALADLVNLPAPDA